MMQEVQIRYGCIDCGRPFLLIPEAYRRRTDPPNEGKFIIRDDHLTTVCFQCEPTKRQTKRQTKRGAA